MLEHNNERIHGKVVGKASTPRSYIIKNKMGIYRRNRRHLIKSVPSLPVTVTHNNNKGGDRYGKVISRPYSPPITRSKTGKTKPKVW